MLKKLFIIIMAAALASFWTADNAKSQTDFGFETADFFIQIIPESPGSNQSVTARLSATSFDIGSAQITWVHNGRVQTQGRGLREYRFTTGALGSRETLSAVAADQNGTRRETSISFSIANVSFLWRAETSAPYWYKGLALPSPKSSIVVSAFPDLISGGRKISAQNLVYRWTLDEDFKQNQSGAGKSAFRFNAGFSADSAHRVSLEVSSIDGAVKAQKSVDIPVVSPSVFVYENDPLSGPKRESSFSGARTDVVFAGEEKSYIAEPFFFSLSNGRPSLEYEWRVNGVVAEATEPKNILNLTITPDASGRASIDVSIQNIANILQRAGISFSIDIF